MMFRFLALACCLGALVQSSKIQMSTTSVNLLKGQSKSVFFNLGEPIICPPSSSKECAVVITIDNPSPEHISYDNCWIKWTASEWHQSRELRITATENFKNDGKFDVTLKTEVIHSGSEYYDNENPADIRVTTTPRPSAECSGTGDPHYTTFDRQYWHVYTAGRYVLYSNPQDDFEVQVATRAYPARHCAFAAKEGNDIFVVDACSGTIRYRRSCGSTECQKKGGYPRVGVAGGSGLYTVTFQSGRQVRASVSPYYMNVYARAPGLDYQSGTEGICGNFNGVKGDDSPCGGCKLHDLAQLLPGQKPTRDLFAWTPSGVVQSYVPVHADECEYIAPAVIPPILNQPNVEDITDILKQMADLGEDEGPQELVIDDVTVIGDGEPMAEAAAKSICTQVFTTSAVGEICERVLPNFDINDYINDCTEDLQLTGNRDFIEDTIEDLENECTALAQRDLSTWEKDDEGKETPNLEISENVCPKGCSGNGDCVNAACICNEGFIGLDCNRSTTAQPEIVSVDRQVCDTMTSGGCPVHIKVAGRNIWNSEDLACGFKFVKHPDMPGLVGDTLWTEALYLGADELLCTVPTITSHRGAQAIEADIMVRISDGSTPSSQKVPFKWFDGVCQVCNSSTCFVNPSSCTIDGTCYRAGVYESNNPCLACEPQSAFSDWTFSYSNIGECSPKFDVDTEQVKITNGFSAGEEIKCVSSENEYTTDDTSNKLVYSMFTGDESYFTVNPDTGCVTALKALTGVPSSQFNQLIGVRVTDSNGLHADTRIVLDIRSTESNSFASDTYSFDVSEAATIGTTIGQVTVADTAQAVTYEWYVQPSNHEDYVTVDASTGEIKVGKKLDFETYHTYHLLLRAKDDKGQFYITSVIINVLDAPEAPTNILLNKTTIAENMPIGTTVGFLSSEDPEGGAFVYTATSADFSIEGDRLVTKRVFDFETDASPMVVEITSTDSTSLSFSKSFSVAIEDVNEAPTDIALSQTTFSEDSAFGKIATVSVRDPDGDLAVCTLVENGDGLMELVANNLILLKKLNFELDPSFVVSIGCADDGSPSMMSEVKQFTITVINANDGPSDIRFVSSVGDVAEDVEPGTLIGQIVAIDEDSDATTITLTTTDDSVSIGAGVCEQRDGGLTGVECRFDVTTNVELDFESSSSGELSVAVTGSDNVGAEIKYDVPIKLKDVNEKPTGVEWAGSSGVVFENQTGVLGVLRGTDPDEENVFKFTLASHTDVFKVQQTSALSTTCELVLLDGASLEASTMSISITVEDQGGLSTTTSFSLVVELEPIGVSFETKYQTEVDISESTPAGTSLGRLIVTGGSKSASYVVSVADPHFSISGMDLVLDQQLSYEDEQEMIVSFTVTRSDARRSADGATVTLTIRVLDVDEAPVFGANKYSAEVDINSKVGTSLSVTPSISAADPEGTEVSYTLEMGTSGLPADLFDVEVNADKTVRLLLAINPSVRSIDAGSHTFQIVALSGGLSSSQDVTVTFTDGQGTPSASSASSKSSSTGMIAGIIVAVLCLLLLAIAFVVYSRKNDDPMYDKSASKLEAQFDNPTFQNPGAVYSAVGDMPATFVPGVSNPMYEWYRPEMSRQECTDHLVSCPAGSFVVRDSKATPGWHILGVKTEAEVLHEKIRATDDGQYQLLPSQVSSTQPRFNDLPQLISFYGESRSGVNFSLDVNSFANPMYGASSDMFHSGARVANDPAAPVVPLKEREMGQVAQLASGEYQDIYSNTQDAKNAMSRA